MLPLLLALSISVPSFAAWEGHYSYREEVSNEGEWTGSLDVKACKPEGCDFTYQAGSEMGECSAAGRFSLKGKTGTFTQGGCVVTLEARSPDLIFVDGNSAPDSNACNDLCGIQGARYFGLELRRASANGPSFPCEPAKKLSKVEKAICASPDLSALDAALAARYKAAKKSPNLATEQRVWLRLRNSECGKATNVTGCLKGVYKARAAKL